MIHHDLDLELELSRTRINVCTVHVGGRPCAYRFGLRFVVAPITKANYLELLSPGGPAPITAGDFVVNLSVNISSVGGIVNLHAVVTVQRPWTLRAECRRCRRAECHGRCRACVPDRVP